MVTVHGTVTVLPSVDGVTVPWVLFNGLNAPGATPLSPVLTELPPFGGVSSALFFTMVAPMPLFGLVV